MFPVAGENVAHLVLTDLTVTCWNKHAQPPTLVVYTHILLTCLKQEASLE